MIMSSQCAASMWLKTIYEIADHRRPNHLSVCRCMLRSQEKWLWGEYIFGSTAGPQILYSIQINCWNLFFFHVAFLTLLVLLVQVRSRHADWKLTIAIIDDYSKAVYIHVRSVSAYKLIATQLHTTDNCLERQVFTQVEFFWWLTML